ncbi:MAG TPA: DUF4421 domain-containing protein, partial [Chitinophagaceae bacterium]|nr:DUF4421 domain-containing protein [Chitinophagaceae bacterium]
MKNLCPAFHSSFLSLVLIISCIGTTHAQLDKLSEYDSTYYVTYPGSIIGRLYFSQKYTTLELRNGNAPPRLRYRPNTNLNLGVGATYRALTLNVAYGFGFLNRDEEKGENRKLDLQARIYSRRWAIDFFGQFYRGYFLFPKGRAEPGGDDYYIRPDLKVNVAGISAYRILNFKRFTMRSAFMQDEHQKKSAGSFLLGAELYYAGFRGDSALVPSELFSFYDRRNIDQVRALEIGPGISYAYTLVLPANFYLFGSFGVNTSLGLTQETGIGGTKNHVSLNANLLYRAAAGYNNGNWNVSAFWLNSRFAARGISAGNSYVANTGNYRLIFSKRLQPGPKLKKLLRPVDRVMGKIADAR